MALIKCKECDGLISDKATKCPHCGSVIEQEEMRTCPECGHKVKVASLECSNCGYVFSQNANTFQERTTSLAMQDKCKNIKGMLYNLRNKIPFDNLLFISLLLNVAFDIALTYIDFDTIISHHSENPNWMLIEGVKKWGYIPLIMMFPLFFVENKTIPNPFARKGVLAGHFIIRLWGLNSIGIKSFADYSFADYIFAKALDSMGVFVLPRELFYIENLTRLQLFCFTLLLLPWIFVSKKKKWIPLLMVILDVALIVFLLVFARMR